MSLNLKALKSLRKGSFNVKNSQKIGYHRQAGPPYYLTIVVQGVGFEPTNL
jgi:hypothetical protein